MPHLESAASRPSPARAPLATGSDPAPGPMTAFGPPGPVPVQGHQPGKAVMPGGRSVLAAPEVAEEPAVETCYTCGALALS